VAPPSLAQNFHLSHDDILPLIPCDRDSSPRGGFLFPPLSAARPSPSGGEDVFLVIEREDLSYPSFFSIFLEVSFSRPSEGGKPFPTSTSSSFPPSFPYIPPQLPQSGITFFFNRPGTASYFLVRDDFLTFFLPSGGTYQEAALTAALDLRETPPRISRAEGSYPPPEIKRDFSVFIDYFFVGDKAPFDSGEELLFQ